MFGSIHPSSSAKESQVIHTEKSTPPHNLLFNSFRTITNEPLELKIREKETLLYQAAIKNPNLKEMPSVKESILQDDRLHSLGMAVTTVANIDMINNAYPHQNIKVDAQTEKTVNEICDNAPRGKAVDIGEDNAINNRGKAFISGFLTYQSPIDVTHYALALNIGHSSKSNEIDHIMINQFTDLWKIRSETSKPVDTH